MKLELEPLTLQSILQGVSYFAFFDEQKSQQQLLNVVLESGVFMKIEIWIDDLMQLQRLQIEEAI